MLSCASPQTGWSAQQDAPIKERLTTPLPRTQMGMYPIARVISAMVVTERDPCY